MTSSPPLSSHSQDKAKWLLVDKLIPFEFVKLSNETNRKVREAIFNLFLGPIEAQEVEELINTESANNMNVKVKFDFLESQVTHLAEPYIKKSLEKDRWDLVEKLLSSKLTYSERLHSISAQDCSVFRGKVKDAVYDIFTSAITHSDVNEMLGSPMTKQAFEKFSLLERQVVLYENSQLQEFLNKRSCQSDKDFISPRWVIAAAALAFLGLVIKKQLF